MRYVIMCCAAALLVGCSDSPTSPTPITEPETPIITTPAPRPALTPSNLQWDRIGSGCQAEARPNPIPSGTPVSLEERADDSGYGIWSPYEAEDGRRGLLTATFVLRDNAWVLCSWEMSDV